MSFPSYSTLFKLGLSANGCSSSSSRGPSPKRQRTEPKRSMRSFLKLDVEQALLPAPSTPIASTSSSRQHSPSSSPASSHLGLPSVPLVRRRSRDSLRALPAKPAPQTTLPPAPVACASAPATPSTAASTLPPYTPPSQAFPISSEPSTSTTGADADDEDEGESRVRAVTSPRSSIVSPRRRLASRSEALAALEGRLRSKPVPRARNFMSMSDDEDDDEDDTPLSPTAFTRPPRPAPSPPVSAPAAPAAFVIPAMKRTQSIASRRTTLSLAYALAAPGSGSFFELDDGDDLAHHPPARTLALGSPPPFGRSFIDIGVSAF